MDQKFQRAPAVQKVIEKLKPNTESKSDWVFFPHIGAKYLLPVVKRSRMIKPIFHDDGSISIDSEDANKELGSMVDQFVMTMAEAKSGKLSMSVEMLKHFYKLLHTMITTNYEYKPETVNRIMTMNEKQLGQMVQIIFFHCLGE